MKAHLLILAVAAVLAAAPASGQVVDPTDVPPVDTTGVLPTDTTGVQPADATGVLPPDTTGDLPADTTQIRAAGDAVGFEGFARGTAVVDSLPVLTPAVDLADLLARVPGSFTYLFDMPGWPDGWSPYGLPPHAVSLAVNGLPFEHLFTGRPAYELAPTALLRQPRLDANVFGRPFAALTRVRPFVSPEPITEGRYWRGGDGLQSIEAMHAQHRRRPLFGREGFLNVLGAYSGRGADGEYPGSRLRRARQVLLRVRYEQRGWSVELRNLHNRRWIGAHGGVVADPNDIESIYRRTAAAVIDPDAQRRIIRNDLAATFRARTLSIHPTNITAFWTAETFRYAAGVDTLGAASDRFGLRAIQPLVRSRSHQLDVRLEAWNDRIGARDQFEAPRLQRSEVHAYVADSVRAGALRAVLHGGVDAYGSSVHPSALVSASYAAGPVRISVEASSSARPASPLGRTGFARIGGAAGLPDSHVLFGRTAMTYTQGSIDATVGAFAHRTADAVDYFAVGSDSAAVRVLPTAVLRAGGYASVGWRRDAQRGFYSWIDPVVSRVANSAESPLHARLADAAPTVSVRGRFGARYRLFQGDLDIDAYVQMLSWSELRSRTLHPEAGLLVVTQPSARIFGPSSVLDAVLEARVREAKLFLLYENVLSGTALMRGNLLVPLYPLPAQRFRFGVYWPIFG